MAIHPIGAAGTDPWFAFGTQAGFVVAIGRERDVAERVTFAFRPEIGFAYDARPGDGGARLTTGIGVGIHSVPVAAFWVPQLVVGPGAGAVATGIRNAVRVEFVFGIVGLDVAHQWLHGAATDLQSVEVLLAVDPGIAVTWLHWLMTRWD